MSVGEVAAEIGSHTVSYTRCVLVHQTRVPSSGATIHQSTRLVPSPGIAPRPPAALRPRDDECSSASASANRATIASARRRSRKSYRPASRSKSARASMCCRSVAVPIPARMRASARAAARGALAPHHAAPYRDVGHGRSSALRLGRVALRSCRRRLWAARYFSRLGCEMGG